MNYSLLEEIEDNINDNINDNIIDKYKEINEELLCVKIMEDYNKLKNDLEKSKKELEDLYKKKEYFYNYQNNIYNGHLNILDIIENKNSGENLNEIIINYNNLTKDIYNDWYKNKFEPTKDNLETNINKIENSLVKIRRTFINIINNLINKNDDVLNKKMCPICFENEIDMCSIPCGHTCCNKCIISSRSNYNNNKRCLSCRNEINDNIKIYFLI